MAADKTDRYAEERERLKKLLTSGGTGPEGHLRSFFGFLPRDPRCKLCNAPFAGAGAAIVRLVFRIRPSNYNPNFCTNCFDALQRTGFGTEIRLSLLFADIRGSTRLAEGMTNMEFRDLIDCFYRTATKVLIKHGALIDKLMGDGIMAVFAPGFAGPGHPGKALEAAQDLLHAFGYHRQGHPWLPVGIGVHTGEAYLGVVGSKGGVTDFTALGDSVNITARLASLAEAGEVLASN